MNSHKRCAPHVLEEADAWPSSCLAVGGTNYSIYHLQPPNLPSLRMHMRAGIFPSPLCFRWCELYVKSLDVAILLKSLKVSPLNKSIQGIFPEGPRRQVKTVILWAQGHLSYTGSLPIIQCLPRSCVFLTFKIVIIPLHMLKPSGIFFPRNCLMWHFWWRMIIGYLEFWCEN